MAKFKSNSNRINILNYLPRDQLLQVFDYLDETSLVRSRSVSKSWKDLTDDDSIWNAKYRRLKRWNPIWADSKRYSWKERYFYAKKWSRARIDQSRCLDLHKKYLPWLHLLDDDPDQLYIACGSQIDRYRAADFINNNRNGNGPPTAKRRQQQQRRRPVEWTLSNPNPKDDFCRFVVRKYGDRKFLAAGTRGGFVYLADEPYGIEEDSNSIEPIRAHTSDVHCVDLIAGDSGGELRVISGSRDRTVRIWSIDEKNGVGPTMCAQLDLDDRAWCLEANRDKIAIGSAACWNECPPLSVWDLESDRVTHRLGRPCKRGAGILDLNFTSASTILAAGYDSAVRIWDLRTSQHVWQWEETYNSAVYCVRPELNGNSMFVGTSRYGLVWMLDKRWPRATVQSFYVGQQNGPVYSMVASTKSLFVGLDREICAVKCV